MGAPRETDRRSGRGDAGTRSVVSGAADVSEPEPPVTRSMGMARGLVNPPPPPSSSSSSSSHIAGEEEGTRRNTPPPPLQTKVKPRPVLPLAG